MATLATHSAPALLSPGTTTRPTDVDEDQRALADYNAWLQGLAPHRSRG